MKLPSCIVVLVLGAHGGCDSAPVTRDRVEKAPINDSRTGEAKAEDARMLDPETLELKVPATVAVADGPVTVATLVRFLPDTLGGARMEYRQAVDDAVAAAAYRTPTGFINVNLALTRDVAFDRAQVEGAASDEVKRSDAAGITKRGVAVGPHRGLFVTFTSGSKVELLLFFGDRISVRVSREGMATPQDMVALATELDLAGLAGLAARVPAPPPH